MNDGWKRVSNLVELPNGNRISFHASVRYTDQVFTLRIWHNGRTVVQTHRRTAAGCRRVIREWHDAWAREQVAIHDGEGYESLDVR